MATLKTWKLRILLVTETLFGDIPFINTSPLVSKLIMRQRMNCSGVVYSRTVRHTHINKDTTNIWSHITTDFIIHWWTKINWIKRDQLDVTCFIISLFTAQHVSDVNTSILRMQAEALVLQPAYGYHTTPAKPQRNTNTQRTRTIQPMK